MKRSMLLLLITVLVLASATPALAGTDDSRSYAFDLTVNGSGQAATVAVGDVITVELSLRRTDIAAPEKQEIYALQERLYYNSTLFELIESSITKPMDGVTEANIMDSSNDGEKFLNIVYRSGSGNGITEMEASFVIATVQFKALQAGSYTFAASDFKKVTTYDGRDIYTATQSAGVAVTIAGTAEAQQHNINLAHVSNGSIKASAATAAAGETVTLTATPDSGYSLDEWDISYSVSGVKTVIDVSKATSVSFTMPAAAVTVSASFTKDNSGNNGGNIGGGGGGISGVATGPKPTTILDDSAPLADIIFNDVLENHWAYEYVTYLAGRGFVTGKTADLFAPSDAITRAEFVTILARMSGAALPSAYSGPFADVESGAYYEQAVAWAVEAGVVRGTSDTTFSPHNLILRQEIAAMIVRYAAYNNFDFLQYNQPQQFSDGADIHDYAQEAVSVMQQADIINGYEDGRFLPLNNATRAEAAKMLALVHYHMQ